MTNNKLLLLIPVVIFSYLLIMNLFSIVDDKTYEIDIGSLTDMQGTAYMIGPIERISQPIQDINDEHMFYRNFLSEFIYFGLNNPILKNDSIIDVKMKFRADNSSVIKIGARNKTGWNYTWNKVYDPFEKYLNKETKIINSNENINVYSTNKNISKYQSSNDLLFSLSYQNISKYQSVNNLFFNLGNKTIAISPLIDAYPGAYNINSTGKGISINASLRGKHSFYAYVKNNELKIEFIKQDLNWYNNKDDLEIKIIAPDGKILESTEIVDDGIVNNTHKVGPLQSGQIYLTNIKPGTYKIIADTNDDVIIDQIKISSDKFVIINDVFAYAPTKLYTEAIKGQNVFFKTPHKEGMQKITLNYDDLIQTIDINDTNVDKEVNVNKSRNLQTWTIPRGDMIISSNLYYSLTPESYFIPVVGNVIKLEDNVEFIKKNNVSYIVTNNNRDRITFENGWIVAKTQWNAKDLYIPKDNILQFATHIVKSNNSSHIEIPVDWIKITVK